MNRFTKQIHLRNLIKESFDNLPSGVCFFSNKGLVVLCNYQMSNLIFDITGHDLQSLEELQNILKSSKMENGVIKEDSCFVLPNGTSWSFSIKQIEDPEGNKYTEAIASNVTKLREKKRQLLESNQAKRQTIEALENIQQNVVAITREEEILSMKMKLHNEFGYNLQTIRKFFQNGCLEEEKEVFIQKQRNTISKMQGEINNEDEIDPLNELEQLAAALEMKIIIKGKKPDEYYLRELLSYAMRECLTNTICHADGNQVFVDISYKDNNIDVVFTNSGKQPKNEIIEGGGLTSLRTRIENAGGIMVVKGLPKFSLSISIPIKGEEL